MERLPPVGCAVKERGVGQRRLRPSVKDPGGVLVLHRDPDMAGSAGVKDGGRIHRRDRPRVMAFIVNGLKKSWTVVHQRVPQRTVGDSHGIHKNGIGQSVRQGRGPLSEECAGQSQTAVARAKMPGLHSEP